MMKVKWILITQVVIRIHRIFLNYDLKKIEEVRFTEKEAHLLSGKLDETIMDDDEKQFQILWKTYFSSIGIHERINPKRHRQHMPVRFWAYMPEKILLLK